MKKLLVSMFLFLMLTETTTFAQIQVAKSTFSKIGALIPQIATNQSSGESLVVWLASNNSGNFILGRLMTDTGKPKGKALKLVPTAIWVFDPALAYNPTLNEYLLVWDDRPDNADRHILGQRLDPSGKPIGKTIDIFKTGINWYPRVAFNPVTGGYNVVWSYHPDGARLTSNYLASQSLMTARLKGNLW